jgi:hypothetical protein
MADSLFRFPGAKTRDSEVSDWFKAPSAELADLARTYFEKLRQCGSDVRELLHDGHPTACLEDAAFAYVNAFTSHVNLGFFRGAELPDPGGLLQGTGRFMRHLKLKPGVAVDAAAVQQLIDAAYQDMRRRIQEPSG